MGTKSYYLISYFLLKTFYYGETKKHQCDSNGNTDCCNAHNRSGDLLTVTTFKNSTRYKSCNIQ
jgi:hypothetical protein